MTEACKKHGGFYLGSIGGPAAILAQNCIRKVEVLEYPELGKNFSVVPHDLNMIVCIVLQLTLLLIIGLYMLPQ